MVVAAISDAQNNGYGGSGYGNPGLGGIGYGVPHISLNAPTAFGGVIPTYGGAFGAYGRPPISHFGPAFVGGAYGRPPIPMYGPGAYGGAIPAYGSGFGAFGEPGFGPAPYGVIGAAPYGGALGGFGGRPLGGFGYAPYGGYGYGPAYYPFGYGQPAFEGHEELTPYGTVGNYHINTPSSFQLVNYNVPGGQQQPGLGGDRAQRPKQDDRIKKNSKTEKV